MQVQRLRGADGLVPAGAYFAAIAMRLEEMNVGAAELEEKDRRLDARRRRRARGDPGVMM